MQFLFKVIKFFFCLLTIAVGVIYMRGEFLFPEGNTLLLLKLFLVPGYLVFCGIMIGYLMFIFWS